jgi:hypothetical protein
MERQPVTSSNIKSFGYDIKNAILEVEFLNGSIYQYKPVPVPVASGMAEAVLMGQSVGKYFIAHIRGNPNYEVTKIERSK